MNELQQNRLLTTLQASENQFTEIPDLPLLRNLCYLDFRDNQIENIQALEHCKKLIFLKLERNQISNSSRLVNLPHLQYLYLFGNTIETIPAGRVWRQLKWCDLIRNRLKHMPDYCHQLKNFHWG